MKYLPIVWRNLLRRKVRTIFTVLSVFVAFVLFGYLMAIRAAFSMGVDLAGVDRLMVLNKTTIIMPLLYSYGEQIRRIEGVTDITHANWFGAYYQEPKNQFANMAVEAESWLRMYPEFEMPEEQKQAFLADRGSAIVGVDTAKRFGWKVGDRVPLQATIFRRPDGAAWEFNIAGIYDSQVKGTDKTQLFFHWSLLDETFRNSSFFAGQVGWYVIRVADPEKSPEIAKQIDALFANSSAETKTDTEKAFVAGFAKQIGNISLITQLIATAAILLILLVTANTMAQSIRERTNELAVLKTLGYGDARVLSMVLMESCAIAIIGGATGLAVAWVLILGGDPTGGFLPLFFFPVRDVVYGGLFVLLLGFVAGAMPAWQAGRLRIVDALRRN
jgi:putative ABC transport system permease protein